MARYLFYPYTTADKGDIYPFVPIVEELERRGHDVAVMCPKQSAELLQGIGLDGRPIDPAIERIPDDDWSARTSIGRVKRLFDVRLQCAPLEAADMLRAIEDFKPDAIVVEPLCWGAATVAELWDGPWAQCAPYILPIPSRDVPPYGQGLKPRDDFVGSIRDTIMWSLSHGWYSTTILPGVNKFRRSLGAAPIPVREYHSFFHNADLVMMLTDDEFDYPRSDWPDNVRLVGVTVWEPPAPEPEWLQAIDSPIVLVSLSTRYQDDGELIDCAIRALRDEDVYVIATSGAVDPITANTANARVERFVPHGPILERAACVVTHAGMGTTQKALSYGVPVCAVPFGRDQPEVARRVEYAKAGVCLPSRRLTERKLRSAVRKAIEMKPGAQRMSQLFAAGDGAATAADSLEELVASRAPGSRTPARA